MSDFIVLKAFKANGKSLKIGDRYEIGTGMHDDKLISQRYVKQVDEVEAKAIQNSAVLRNEARQKNLQPEKYNFTCECGFEAKSSAGLAAHMRKHEREDK